MDSEKWKPDKETVEAWQWDNDAAQDEKIGNKLYASYEREESQRLRFGKMHRAIVKLFDRSDAQDAIIDIGLSMKGKKVPEIDKHERDV